MIGPKLDARTYAIFILALMGAAISVGLVAQTRESALTSPAEVAAATRDVATATREVAAANREIAASLKELAEAVRSVQTTMEKQGKGGSAVSIAAAPAPAEASAASTEGGETVITPGEKDEPPPAIEPEPTVRGVFEIKR